jgi:hypothetical protein
MGLLANATWLALAASSYWRTDAPAWVSVRTHPLLGLLGRAFVGGSSVPGMGLLGLDWVETFGHWEMAIEVLSTHVDRRVR